MSKKYKVEVCAYSEAKTDGAVSTDYVDSVEEANKSKIELLGTQVYDDGATIDFVITEEGYLDEETGEFTPL